jgi:hypothetical protein
MGIGPPRMGCGPGWGRLRLVFSFRFFVSVFFAGRHFFVYEFSIFKFFRKMQFIYKLNNKKHRKTIIPLNFLSANGSGIERLEKYLLHCDFEPSGRACVQQKF